MPFTKDTKGWETGTHVDFVTALQPAIKRMNADIIRLEGILRRDKDAED